MPDGLLYQPDFISRDEEAALLALGWHRDVPEFELIAGVSLAGRCRMRFRPYPPKPRARVFVLDLEPRSVYVLRDEIRWRWQHSVAPTGELRHSITFRTRRL